MTILIVGIVLALLFGAYKIMDNGDTGEGALSDAVVAAMLLFFAALVGAGYGLVRLVEYLVSLM